jgi:hypothetical protein
VRSLKNRSCREKGDRGGRDVCSENNNKNRSTGSQACHSSVQKKSAHNLSYNNNITKVLHTFLWIGGMFTK